MARHTIASYFQFRVCLDYTVRDLIKSLNATLKPFHIVFLIICLLKVFCNKSVFFHAQFAHGQLRTSRCCMSTLKLHRIFMVLSLPSKRLTCFTYINIIIPVITTARFAIGFNPLYIFQTASSSLMHISRLD
ncbi:hypothetical protein K438DRAFT_1982707 [Mycena galopus ATCC 62051]|nr:hypothetical protein K438DRAFT_1982707 [Mycena galopus ATCC 62051]